MIGWVLEMLCLYGGQLYFINTYIYVPRNATLFYLALSPLVQMNEGK